MTRESRAAVIVGEASTMIVRPVPVTCSCSGTCINGMGVVIYQAETEAQGAEARVAGSRTSGERVLPFFLDVRCCGHGAGRRVQGGERGSECVEVQGEEECMLRAGEERSGHLSIVSVSAEEKQKRAQQSA